MQKILNVIIRLIVFSILIINVVSFADTNIKSLPWYLEVNNIKKCWWDKDVRGQNVVVEVWDSKINFELLSLKNKKYKEGHDDSYITDSNKDYDFRMSMHGTAMASLIAADESALNCSFRSQYSCNKAVVAGVAPDAKIFNRVVVSSSGQFSMEDRFKILMDSLKLREKRGFEKNVSSAGKNIIISEPDVKEAKIILINASITEGDSKYTEIGQLKKHDDFKHLLLVAGVGNVYKKVDKDTLPFPARLKFRKGFNVLAVGATKQYKDSQQINILDFSQEGSEAGSAYGNEVDILAPGDKIPALTQTGEAYVGSGTSESTAIVTGALTLLASCNPYATASELKDALLTNSNKTDHLKTKVNNGQVLDIYKAIDNYCHAPAVKTKNGVCNAKGVCTKHP